MGEVPIHGFEYMVPTRYLDTSKKMLRERYSHIDAGEPGAVATEALEDVDM